MESLAIDALSPGLWAHYQSQELCDVSIISSDGQRFRAHKIILASASRYFEAHFLGAGKHLHGTSMRRPAGSEMEIQLEAVDAESLAAILASIYHGEVGVGEGNVDALLLASNYLDVAPVKAACCQVSPVLFCPLQSPNHPSQPQYGGTAFKRWDELLHKQCFTCH